jgi:simple sugar transport system substrate-binding protein
MNSGSGVSKELGAIMHVGQPEYDAGKGGGERSKGLGGSKGVCFNHEPFNSALLDRCQGFADGMGEQLNMVEVSQDFDDIKNTVIAYLTSNPDTNAVMAVGPTGCDPTISAIEEIGKAGDIVLGCFDLGPQIVDGIIGGTVHYAIDQQQFLQGYIPVVVLHLNHRNGTLPGNSINSGPGFVTTANIDQVKALAGVER